MIALSANQASTDRVEASLKRMSDLTREVGNQEVPLLLFQGVAKLLVAPSDQTGELLVKTALEQAEKHAELAALRSHAHMTLGATYNVLGKFREALAHSEKAIETYDPTYQAPVADSKAFAMAECAAALWFIGLPEKAHQQAEDAIAFAEKISHAPAIAYTSARAATIYSLTRDSRRALALSEWLLSFASDKDLRIWRAWALFLRGGSRAELGEPEEGCRMMRSALAELDSRDTPRSPATTVHPRAVLRFHEVPAGLLRPREAAEHLQGLAEECVRHGADAFLPDIYRMLALLKIDDKSSGDKDANEAEALLRKALAIVQSQGSLSFELRVALDLCRLLHRHRKDAEARKLLSPIYAKFTEGHRSQDLRSAGSLLAEL
jgi:tetratricopeptide (TPR) repeat protein